MNSKERILSNLRYTALEGDTSYPEYSHPHKGITNPSESFRNVLEAVGGECHMVKSYDEIKDHLATTKVYRSARDICSYVKEVEEGNVDIKLIDDVHELRDVDLAIVRGEFGIGENAAVWVNADGLKHRGVLFLAENLVLIIDSGRIVPDMERAYALIDFNNLTSGYFISGPSKTADIEQCLVIGAHGAKSLIVYVIEQ